MVEEPNVLATELSDDGSVSTVETWALRSSCGIRYRTEKGTSVSGSRCRRLVGFALACCLLSPAAATAASPLSLRLTASCAGDTILGRVAVSAPRRTTFTLRLLERKTEKAPWVAIGRSRQLRAVRGTHAYLLRFDVAAYQADAYRLRLTRPTRTIYSAPVLAASCAPGHQVPEAPLALLLPLTLLATSGGLLLRRRRLS